MASIIRQVWVTLESMTRFNQSRHEAKRVEKTYVPDGIFSYSTYATYLKQCCHFAKWVRKRYGCNTLEKAKQYVPEYLQTGIDKGDSASTLYTRRSALSKLYQCKAIDWNVKLPKRRRADITRSRGDAVRDRDFSEKNNGVMIFFCLGSGLRRHELDNIKPSQIQKERGRLLLVNVYGKGGKSRNVEVLKEYVQVVLDAAKGKAPDEKIFTRIPSHMDVHGYRREYTQALYERLARPPDALSKSEKYICREDKKGVTYDKKAMLQVSRQLGHNRIGIIASSYLG